MDQMTKYHHLGPEERAVIMLERDRGSSLRRIATILKRSPATVSRELQRNSPAVRYCATRAGAAYKRRRQRSVRPRKLASNRVLCDIVWSRLLDLKWSPEQIAATLKADYPEQPAYPAALIRPGQRRCS